MATVEALPELCNLLLFCKRKSSLKELIELMKYSFDYDSNSTKALLLQMIDLQLLFSNLHSNIIGDDYFKRLNISTNPKPSNYIIAERNINRGYFKANSLCHLPKLINKLQQILPRHKNHTLETFKQAFLKRFEQRKISLAIVMDPELGIGYGNLAQLITTDPLVTEIELKTSTQKTSKIAYGQLQQFLLRKIIDGGDIDLNEYKATHEVKNCLPNTLSVIFNMYKENLVLASVGGTSANVLLGRFSHCGGEWEEYGQEISHLEKEANEDIAFFDIAYQAEKKVDNVNRRKQLYEYELPLLSWSCSAAPLDLQDILISVERNEVVLSSKKLGKRLMPRVASAYNYTRSDLAVYRFLCDVQAEGLAANLSFSLASFFPHLNHYPRINYKNIIVEQASWLFPVSLVKDKNSLFNWLSDAKVSRQLILGDTDQSLYFDLNEEEFVWAFLRYSKQQEADFYIKEALIDTADFIKDENGLGYHPQYIVNYQHKEQIYQSKISEPTQVEYCFYPPGSKWLYVELYCHISHSNKLLFSLQQLIKSKKQHLINWFFIRYTDPKPHIRLRLQLKDEKEGFQLLSALRNLVEPQLRNGFVSDLQIKNYQPELTRYGAKRMLLVEHFFGIDSSYVLWMLSKSKNEMILKAEALATLQAMCKLAYPAITDQLNFAKIMANSFAKEMKLEAAEFKKINLIYNELKPLLAIRKLILPLRLRRKRDQLLLNILSHCESIDIKQNLLADLIHMHINRLFNTAQRIHETLLYHYLVKILQTEQALAKVE